MHGYTLDPELTPEHLQAIGELTEWQIESAIWLLLPANEHEGRIVTTRMNIRPKTEILESLARLKLSAADRKRLKTLMTDIVTAHEMRNKVIHGLWATNSETGAHQLVWASGKLVLNRLMNNYRLLLIAHSMRETQPSVQHEQSRDP